MTNGDEVAELPFVSRHEIRGGDSYFTRVGEFLCSWRVQSHNRREGAFDHPSEISEPLGEEFVLTRGLDGCLYIYPMDEWEAFEEKLRALPLTNKGR